MGKRKVFTKTDLSIPQVEHSHDATGNVVILPEVMPPTNTTVKFGRNTSNSRNFDFARWYGAGIDPITYACQRQIERFLAGQEGALTVTTVVSYCKSGLRSFLDYCMLRATAFGRDLVLADVNRDLIDSYLSDLAGQRGLTTFRTASTRKPSPCFSPWDGEGYSPWSPLAMLPPSHATPFQTTSARPRARRRCRSSSGKSSRSRYGRPSGQYGPITRL